MVVQQGWPGCPQASHWETPRIATQVFPALHEVPLHGCPVASVPPEELAAPPPLLPEPNPPPLLPEPNPTPLLPEPEPPLLPPEAEPAPLLPDMAPPLPAPSEPASGAEVE